MSPCAAAVFLVCVVLCLHEAIGKCDKEVVSKIKALNVPDYATVLDTLDGDYVVIWVNGIATDRQQYDCSRVRFSKSIGSHAIENENKSKQPDFSYYPIVSSPEVFAVYICDDRENEEAAKKPGYTPVEMTYIAVRVEKTLLGLSSKINAAKELVKSVGVLAGQDVFGCFKAVPTPQEGDALGPIIKSKYCFLQQKFYFHMECEPIGKQQ